MMRRSLASRMAWALLACFMVLALATGLTFTALFEPRYLGVESASMTVSLGVRRGAHGEITLPLTGDLRRAREASPGLWFLIRGRDGRLVSGGRPPERERRLLAALPEPQTSGEDALNFIASDGRPATARWDETEAGPVTLVLGGVSTAEMPLSEWVLAVVAVAVFVLIALGLVFLVLGFVLLPLVLRALRKLAAAAAAVDGTDLGRRLPETELVSELRPVARAFNAALDRVQTASERRDRLIGDIAHELRTPLAVLTLRSEALPESPAALEVRRGLDRLTQLIAQMLDAERLGAADRRLEAVNLVELARGAVAEIAPLAVAEGYQLEFAAESEAVMVQGHPAAIGRAVGNLLGNAVAHAGGTGLIHVRVRAAGVVEVEDAGAGLPPGAHERVFEPFHRERWDRDGCGLGLHLVREVMRAHGGRAEAADGASGALFRLVFPLSAAA